MVVEVKEAQWEVRYDFVAKDTFVKRPGSLVVPAGNADGARALALKVLTERGVSARIRAVTPW